MPLPPCFPPPRSLTCWNPGQRWAGNRLYHHLRASCSGSSGARSPAQGAPRAQARPPRIAKWRQTWALSQELPPTSWGLLESRKQALPQLVAALSWLNKRVNEHQAHSRQALVISGGATAQPHSYPQHTDIKNQGRLSSRPQRHCPLLTADEPSRPEPLAHPYRTPVCARAGLRIGCTVRGAATATKERKAGWERPSPRGKQTILKLTNCPASP